MAPKAASTKKASAPSAHGSYQDMIKDAIIKLKERNGSSRQAIKKYVKANNNLGSTTDNAFTAHVNKALKSGVEAGVFEQPKGASGPVKLKKPGEKKAAAPAAKSAKPKTEKKAAAPKKAATGAKKAAAPKKAAAAKPKTEKAAAKPKAEKKAAAPKKAAAKPKAEPAVKEKKPEVIGKTKTGRVVKSAKPEVQTAKAITKKAAAPKKATPKKSTPKKA